MQPLTIEWIDKAEGDFATAQREVRARKQPNYDAACFHAQQCAEKYLKARLQEEGIAIPYTHDLVALLNLLLPIEPSWSTLTPDLRALTVFGVTFRYPGASADRAMARDAFVRCGNVRHIIRASMGL
jgi:HEPN domain-containing protein